MGNPAELSGLSSLVRAVMDTVRDLASRVGRLERDRSVSFELARVTVFTGGTQCTVQYPNYAAGEVPSSGTLTGPTRVVAFDALTAPGVGQNVLIINSPAWSGIVETISAF